MKNLETVSIFGAGKMGTGIALQFASKGFPVTLLAYDEAEAQKIGRAHV